MKKSTMDNLPQNELLKMLHDKQHELLQLSLRKHTGQLEKPHLLKFLRHDVARIKTALHNKIATVS